MIGIDLSPQIFDVVMKVILLDQGSLVAACIFVEFADTNNFIVEEAAKMRNNVEGFLVFDRVPVLPRQEVEHLVLRVEHQCIDRVIIGLETSQKVLSLDCVVGGDHFEKAVELRNGFIVRYTHSIGVVMESDFLFSHCQQERRLKLSE